MSQTPIKTLSAAKQRIAELEAQLAGKAPIATIQPKVTLKPGQKGSFDQPRVADVVSKVAGKLVTSNLTTLPTLEQISAQLESAVAGESKLAILQQAEESYRAEAKRLQNKPVEQVAVLRKLSAVQRVAAVEMLNDPKAWKNRYRPANKLAK